MNLCEFPVASYRPGGMRTVKCPVDPTRTEAVTVVLCFPFTFAKITVPPVGIDTPGGGPPTSLKTPTTTPEFGEIGVASVNALVHEERTKPVSVIARIEVVRRTTANLRTELISRSLNFLQAPTLDREHEERLQLIFGDPT